MLLAAAAIPAVAWFPWQGHGLLGQDGTSSLLGLLVAGAVFLPGFLAKTCGGGDVKFAALCGWIAGLRGSLMLALVAALALGAMSAVRLATGRSAARTARLPAGPAIALGFAFTLLLAFEWS